MAELGARSFESPDQTMTFDNGKADIAKVGGLTIVRSTFEPGWRWSESVKKLVGTDSCQTHHVGYAISGQLHVRTDDGSEQDIMAGTRTRSPRATTDGSSAMRRS
jgi:hypothetical protein